MAAPSIMLAGIPVGAEHPPVFLAEIGTFFNQDIAKAEVTIRRIVEAARQSGGTPVVLKGEILHDASICLDDDTMETYASKSGEVKRERYRALIERKLVPLDTYRALFGIVAAAGMPFMVSVYDPIGADFALESGACALKIASANITNVPLIRHVAAKGLPLVVDSGRASLEDVARAVQTARGAGATQILVEHSPDGHPARPEAHNLRLLQTYAQAFEVPVGLSDHHVDEEMLYVAVALGASLIEKGVALDAGTLEQDVSHAMVIEDLPRTLRRLNNAWVALGRSRRDPTVALTGTVATSQRQGLVARRDLVSGDRVSADTVGTAWPAKGIPVHHWDIVAGWEVTEPLAQGSVIEWCHVRPIPAR